MKKSILFGTLLYALPLVAAAQQLREIKTLVGSLQDIVTALIPLLIGVALVVFFWGLVKYIFKIGGADAEKQGKQIMIWGLVALFVMVSVWGIIALAQRSLGIQSSPPITPYVFPVR